MNTKIQAVAIITIVSHQPRRTRWTSERMIPRPASANTMLRHGIVKSEPASGHRYFANSVYFSQPMSFR